MLEISKKAEESHLSPIRKFYPYAEAAMKKGVKIYAMNIGQPDIPTDNSYFNAVKGIEFKTDAYAPSLGRPELLKAMEGYYNRMNLDVKASDIVVTTGGSEAILMAAYAILNSGDRVIIPEPFYPNYHTIIKSVGGEVTPLRTFPKDNYTYATEKQLESAMRKNTKAILITNPNNPTGTILNDNDMCTVINFALKNNLYIICDEVYREICFTDDKITSILKYKNARENVIVIDSVSKRFSCCGARIGALISKNEKIIESATKFAQARLSVSTINQIGAAALYNSTSADYFKGIRNEYKKRVEVVVRELNKIKGVHVSPPKGAFYIMATLPIKDVEDFQKFMLTDFEDNKETMMFSPAENFYASKGKGKNEIRLAAVLNEKDLIRAVELLAKGLSVYKDTM